MNFSEIETKELEIDSLSNEMYQDSYKGSISEELLNPNIIPKETVRLEENLSVHSENKSTAESTSSSELESGDAEKFDEFTLEFSYIGYSFAERDGRMDLQKDNVFVGQSVEAFTDASGYYSAVSHAFSEGRGVWTSYNDERTKIFIAVIFRHENSIVECNNYVREMEKSESAEEKETGEFDEEPESKEEMSEIENTDVVISVENSPIPPGEARGSISDAFRFVSNSKIDQIVETLEEVSDVAQSTEQMDQKQAEESTTLSIALELDSPVADNQADQRTIPAVEQPKQTPEKSSSEETGVVQAVQEISPAITVTINSEALLPDKFLADEAMSVARLLLHGVDAFISEAIIETGAETAERIEERVEVQQTEDYIPDPTLQSEPVRTQEIEDLDAYEQSPVSSTNAAEVKGAASDQDRQMVSTRSQTENVNGARSAIEDPEDQIVITPSVESGPSSPNSSDAIKIPSDEIASIIEAEKTVSTSPEVKAGVAAEQVRAPEKTPDDEPPALELRTNFEVTHIIEPVTDSATESSAQRLTETSIKPEAVNIEAKTGDESTPTNFERFNQLAAKTTGISLNTDVPISVDKPASEQDVLRNPQNLNRVILNAQQNTSTAQDTTTKFQAPTATAVTRQSI